MLAFQDYVRSAGRRHRSNTELVIGQSRRDGGEPASLPVIMNDLLATIMHSLSLVFPSGCLRQSPKASRSGGWNNPMQLL